MWSLPEPLPCYVSLQIPCRHSDCPFLPAVALPAAGFIDTKLPPQGGVNTNDKDVSFPLCQPEGAYKPEVIETWSHKANRYMTWDVIAPGDHRWVQSSHRQWFRNENKELWSRQRGKGLMKLPADADSRAEVIGLSELTEAEQSLCFDSFFSDVLDLSQSWTKFVLDLLPVYFCFLFFKNAHSSSKKSPLELPTACGICRNLEVVRVALFVIFELVQSSQKACVCQVMALGNSWNPVKTTSHLRITMLDSSLIYVKWKQL